MNIKDLKKGTLIQDGLSHYKLLMFVTKEHPNFRICYKYNFYSDDIADKTLNKADTFYTDIFC